MELKLFNTLTRQKDAFKPLTPGKVGMYVCGITPYDDAHIGHARVYVVFDVLFRLLRHIYGAENVVYVRNFTDIDDKIIQRAAERGEEPTALAQKYIDSFHADMAALGCLPPTHEPRVSTSIQGIVSMVDELIAKGFAYTTPSGDVMYRTSRFPAFGALARRKIDEQQHGSRVKVDEEKEAASDFVLWKANAKSTTKLEQAFAPKNFGAKHFQAEGRPGWHIECSVMSKQHLGPVFDIHGGGEDLMFPHHCCEIAQSEALLAPGQSMAQVWLHNSFITVNGTKMSKSLGNFTTIKDALKKYSPEAIRLWLLQTHYRKPVDYSDDALQASNKRLSRYYQALGRAKETYENRHSKGMPVVQRVMNLELPLHPFIKSIMDDLDTAGALSAFDKIINEMNRGFDKHEDDKFYQYYQDISTMSEYLGVLKHEPKAFLEEQNVDINEFDSITVVEINNKLMDRKFAKERKDFQMADKIRDDIQNKWKIILIDNPDGTTTWRRA